MNKLFFLPVEIWREHVLQCLTLLDIVSVTRACEGHHIYSQFQTLIYGFTLTQFLEVTSTETDILRWCLANNILSNGLSIHGELDVETASFLPTFLARVTSLIFVETNQGFEPTVCARLVYLQLRDCLLFSLGSLAACHNLKSLVLNKCPNITNESLLESLNGCTALEDFVVVDCNAVDSRSVSGVLNQVPRLASIQFCATFDRSFHLASVLTNLVPKPTAYLYTLSVILTPNCTACSTTLRQLATHFPQLQKLHLDGDDPANRVTDADIAFLCTKCPHLVNLSLERFAHLTSAAVQSIALYLPLLQRLRVAHCHKICNEGVIALARGCGKLKSLSLAHCGYITDEAVQEVLLLCTQLEKLDLRTCARVSDAAFAERSTTTLRILDVSQTWVQGAFIEQIPTIVRLKCDDCLNLNTTFVSSIASHLNKIQHLSLDETELCAADILTLSTHLPHLQSVNLSSSKADDAVVRSLVTNCPRLRYVNVSDCSVTKDLVGEVKRLYQDRLKIYW